MADALDSLDGAVNYADWIYSMMEPDLGERVLEVGAGHGTMTQRLAVGRRVTATEVSPASVALLEERYRDDPAVEVRHGDIAETLGSGGFDSIVMVNVLEHIADDAGALRQLRQALVPGGRLFLFVPAFEVLYSEFDRQVGHHRRYRRPQLEALVAEAGLEPVEARYVNSLGALAWWLLAKKLRQVPTRQWSARTYDRAVVPLLRRLERRWIPPFGQSILCVARRPEEAAHGHR
jgi:SAM-dependent methyltransferase